MYEVTANVLRALLASDPSITPEQREAIEIVVNGGGRCRLRIWINETRAAELMGIDRACLNRWRRSGTSSSGEEFAFTVIKTPANGVRYDQDEVLGYVEQLIERGCPNSGRAVGQDL